MFDLPRYSSSAAVLPCQHRFCDLCLRQHLSNNAPTNQLNCPTCQLEIDLENGIDGLQLDQFVGQLHNSFDELQRKVGEASESLSKCCACPSTGLSTVAVCYVCAEKLDNTPGPIQEASGIAPPGTQTKIQYARLPDAMIKRLA